ncbi:MAG: putative Phosphoribosyltransferase [Candidatus Saccharibacteria bacterium]|nr:putative Phosphoribosyltransferase [Candidatus Saccharibacteria bacterium]
MSVIESALNIVAPHDCLICGHEGSLICSWCLHSVRTILPGRCYCCKKVDSESSVCKNCRHKSYLRHVWIASEYGGVAKELVYDLKFNRVKAAARPIGVLMAELLPYFPEEVIVVHIPTATSRRRQRGYDHAELIARNVAKERGLRHATLLARLGQARQVGSRRQIRHEHMARAFRIQKPYLVRGAHILLVDDIVTTGATLEAATRVLKEAGARTIDAVAFAQKV